MNRGVAKGLEGIYTRLPTEKGPLRGLIYTLRPGRPRSTRHGLAKMGICDVMEFSALDKVNSRVLLSRFTNP